MNVEVIVQNYKKVANRDGYGAALMNLAYYLANKIICIRRLEVIYLKRENLISLDKQKYTQHSYRLATNEDLEKMRSENRWIISNELIAGFKSGDVCILSLVNQKVAGYTWIHTAGHPQFFPGLKVKVPADYAYNFAGYTLPEYRGYGLQPFRHHVTLNYVENLGKKGMIGFVEVNNFSSKKGQIKSGYQLLGTITTFGSHAHFITLFSNELKKFGIRRI